MNLFKKKESPCCGTNSSCCESKPTESVASTNNANGIIVLGACCSNSAQTFENVKSAVTQLGLDVQVQNIGDFAIIASYGVMTTPALVVNGKVCAQGRKITVDEAVVLIEKVITG